MTDRLDHMSFRWWWIRNKGPEIMSHPFIQPTESDYEEYLDECLRTNSIFPEVK